MGHVIEADELGRLTLPPELLGVVKPHSRYTVETMGTKLVIESEEDQQKRETVYQEWKRDWDALTEQVTAEWDTDKSAAEVVAEMRR